MKVIKQITLDLKERGTACWVCAKQGDDASRFVQVTLTDGGTVWIPPTGATASLRCVKPDGNGIYDPAVINSDGTVTVELTGQVLAVGGSVRADVTLAGPEGQILSTVSFGILVEPVPLGEGAESTGEFLELQKLVAQAKELLGGGSAAAVAEGIGYMDGGNTIILDNAENGAYTIRQEDWEAPLADVDPIALTVTDTEKEYADLIRENCAPAGAKRLGVYDAAGDRLGFLRLAPDYRRSGTGEKQYSFGALADIHLEYDTAQEDFIRALTWLSGSEGVAFTCVAGDLTVSGTAEEFAAYKSCVDTYSIQTPVYAIAGNHDAYQGLAEDIGTLIGQPLYYSFNQGGDVFIMVGVRGDAEGSLFTTEELQWLYETLEENRNKRCFVFTHVRPQDACGNAFGIYEYDIWGGTEAAVFESLMEHYHNVILFHGHSHLKFYLQYGSDTANYDNIFGCHSVHIPSLAVPRDGDAAGASSRKEVYADSEGYVVDVYERGVMLRGRDFVSGKYLPIASYWLDTSPVTVAAHTYEDPTGTIDTESGTVKVTGITLAASGGSLSVGETLTLTPELTPADATDQTVYWGSSDQSVATVADGVVTAVGSGSAVITATTASQGFTAAYQLTVQSGYTNVLSSAVGAAGSVYGTDGYLDGSYLSGNPGVSGNTSFDSDLAGYFTTGFIPYTKAQADAGTPIYIKGAVVDTTDSNCRMAAYPSYDYASYVEPLKGGANLTNYVSVETLGDQYYRITPLSGFSDFANFADWEDYAYVRFSLPGSGAGVIITIDEPLE